MKVEKNSEGVYVVIVDSADVQLGVTNNIVFWEEMHAAQAEAAKLNKPVKKRKVKVKDESQST